MTKIVMLLPKIEPSTNGIFVGGYVNAVKCLCQGFSRGEGTTPLLVTSLAAAKHRLFEQHRPDWADFLVLANNRSPQSMWFGATFVAKVAMSALARWFRRGAIIHGHSGYAVYAWATLLASVITGRPSVHTVYCPVEAKVSVDGRERSFLTGNVARYALNRVDQVIATSQNVARSLARIGVSSSKIQVIPPSIDVDVFSPRNDGSAYRAKIGQDARIVLYVGNLMHSKGFDVLLDAMMEYVFPRVPNAYLIATFELAHLGFEDRRQQVLQRIAEQKLETRVRLLGFVEDMPGLMAASDVFVVPYRDTQGPTDYPIAAMEAMASGKPVVATRTGALPELIDDGMNGRLVPVGSASEIGRVVTDLLIEPGLARRLGEAGRDRIVSQFSIDEIYSRHAKLYRQLLEDPSRCAHPARNRSPSTTGRL